MKSLNLFEKEEDERGIIFDEVLCNLGFWDKSSCASDIWDICFKLKGYSKEGGWDYFICQDKNGCEGIYRKRKEGK